MREDRFQVWDEHYLVPGHKITAEIPINKITKVPIGLFVAKNDLIADLTDCQWIRDSLNQDTLVHYKEYQGGHVSLILGKDMTPFSVDAMDLIKKYNPISTQDNTVFLQ